MTRPIKDLIVAIIIGLYIGYGATAGMMAGVEIQKLQGELCAWRELTTGHGLRGD